MQALREDVRAAVTDPRHTYETSLGSLSFDENGDTSQRIVSVWAYDPSAQDWRFLIDVWYVPPA